MDGAPFGIEIGKQIRTFIEGRFPMVAAQSLGDSDSLLENGVIDSLGMLDVVGFLEEQLDVVVDDEDIAPENFDSISALTQFVEAKRA